MTIGIIGSSGAVGVELSGLLNKHPVLKDNVNFYSGLGKLDNDKWENKIEEILSLNKIVVISTGDDVSKKIIQLRENIKNTTKIIDCSTTFRTNENWIYGLPEIKGRREKIKDADLIANPGCHSTATILGLMPLIKGGIINKNSIPVINSITGYSGGGKDMIEDFEENPKKEGFQYSVGIEHKHVPEIKNEIGFKNIIFQPEVGNFKKGLKVNTFVDLNKDGIELGQNKIIELFKKYYRGNKFIKIKGVDGDIYSQENNDTQNVSIYIVKHNTKLQIISIIDNMMKGSAGAVIQNLNIMLGQKEDLGLVS